MKDKIIHIISLILIVGLIGVAIVSASSALYNSNVVGYDNSSSGMESDNVQDALDELYNMTQSSTASCPNGYGLAKIDSYNYRCVALEGDLQSFFETAVMDNTSSTYVTSTLGIDFNNYPSDTNGKGLYIRSGTENDTHPIFYYRGAVENNYVIFANFCWRIIRTTETGGVKLVYSGTPTSNGTACPSTSLYNDYRINGYVKFNDNADSLADVGYMYGTRHLVKNGYANVLTGKSFTYSNGTYQLVDTSQSDFFDDNRHYSCNGATSCSTLRYVIERTTDGSSKEYYYELENGKDIDDILNEMFSNDNDSLIKQTIDAWYVGNLNNFSSYLEDTVFCNDRSLSSIYTGKLPTTNPNGGYITEGLTSAGRYRIQTSHDPILSCPNINDSFTVSSSIGNGKLDYPIGLLTLDELMIVGFSSSAPHSFTSSNYASWTMTPYFSSGTNSFAMATHSSSYSSSVMYKSNAAGIRPVISLKPGVSFAGTGVYNDPYIPVWS